jgi:hypothetical protein
MKKMISETISRVRRESSTRSMMRRRICICVDRVPPGSRTSALET